MKIEHEIEILEQRLTKGSITDAELNQLLELLKEVGEVDSWLERELNRDVNRCVEFRVDSKVTYKNKQFLKEIADPIEFLTSDTSIVYENKRVLYRRGSRLSWRSQMTVGISVAATIIFAFVCKYHTFETNQEMVPLFSLSDTKMDTKEAIVKIDQFKHTYFEPILSKQLSKIELTPRVKVSSMPKLSNINIVIQIERVASPPTQYNEIKPDDLVLFAQAQEWIETESKEQEEMTIHSDEWIESRGKRRGRVLNRLRRIRDNII